MKYSVPILLSLLFCSKTVLAVSVYDNPICFGNIDTVNSHFEFQAANYSITAGAIFEGLYPQSNTCINVRAGRSNSNQPVSFFQNTAFSYGYTALPIIGSVIYEEPSFYKGMNFSFKLDNIIFWSHGLSLTCNNVLFGQQGLSNSWVLQPTLNDAASNGYLGYLNCNNTYGGRALLLSHWLDSYSLFVVGTDTIYDNEIQFSNLTQVGLTILDSYIVDGRSFFGAKSNDSNSIHIISERGNSSTVVKNVQASMEASGIDWNERNMVGAQMNDKGTPNELSFAVRANLSFTYGQIHYICPGVYLGQGQKGSKHNWWVIANNNSYSQSVSCRDSDRMKISKFKISATGDSSYVFQLNKIDK